MYYHHYQQTPTIYHVSKWLAMSIFTYISPVNPQNNCEITYYAGEEKRI